MIRTIATVIFAMGLAGSALAFQCPGLMAEIDQALPTADITAEERAQVEELRAQGEEAHDAGDHQASEAALNEAKQILGL